MYALIPNDLKQLHNGLSTNFKVDLVSLASDTSLISIINFFFDSAIFFFNFFALLFLRRIALTFSAIAVSDDGSFFKLALHFVQVVMHLKLHLKHYR